MHASRRRGWCASRHSRDRSGTGPCMNHRPTSSPLRSPGDTGKFACILRKLRRPLGPSNQCPDRQPRQQDRPEARLARQEDRPAPQLAELQDRQVPPRELRHAACPDLPGGQIGECCGYPKRCVRSVGPAHSRGNHELVWAPDGEPVPVLAAEDYDWSMMHLAAVCPRRTEAACGRIPGHGTVSGPDRERKDCATPASAVLRSPPPGWRATFRCADRIRQLELARALVLPVLGQATQAHDGATL